MTRRLPVPPAPGPLETYCQQFDALFRQHNQRDRFRRYLEGLLLPAERNKTLTALAKVEERKITPQDLLALPDPDAGGPDTGETAPE